MKLSQFGKRFAKNAGITTLMDDLGKALAHADSDVMMLGGGNPAHVPEAQKIFHHKIQKLLDDSHSFQQLVGVYDPPAGHPDYLKALAALLRQEFGWNISDKNICVTNGSQSSFFNLFNLFAGPMDDGSHKKILLPLAPEYIGYSDIGLADHFFETVRPKFEHLDEHLFKYFIDFDKLHVSKDIGAICVSRPTNPTGNVLTDAEIQHLDELAKQHDIPLIIDGAYGTPFPNLIYTDAKPFWNDNIIMCLSLSKLGLPAARTGIIIANEELIKIISNMTAIVSLSPGSFGPLSTLELIQSGEIIRMSNEVVKPFYEAKAKQAVEWVTEFFGDLPYAIHKPEGAMFLWFWFKDLPISSTELYERLKAKNVIVVSGEHFFPGIDEDWKHKHECIRVNYSQADQVVHDGFEIIAQTVAEAYQEAR